jgi:type VI secretion system protein ImpH
MAASDRPPVDNLSALAELEREPYEFDFHVALRRIEVAFRDRPRLGTAVRPAEEPVRLGQDPSMAFAPAELTAFTAPRDGAPGRLSIAFLGLFGPNGPLPTHLTEFARDRLRNAGDATFARFVDIFQHRLFLLFQRAWASTQPVAEHDRPDDDRFEKYLGALGGFAFATPMPSVGVPDEVRWYYAGLLTTGNRSAEGLASLLSDYYGAKVRIEEFIGEWAALPESSRFRLGGSSETSALGRTSVIGERVRLCQHRFRIVMGPLGRAPFERMLPGREGLDRLVSLVRTYAGDELSWDVRLVPAGDATDQLRLGAGGRIGWNTRLGHRMAVRVEELIVDPSSMETRRASAAVSSQDAVSSKDPVASAHFRDVER